LSPKLTDDSRRCNARSYSSSEEDIENIAEREQRAFFKGQNILKEWTIEGYVRSIASVIVELDLILNDASGNVNSVRASKSSKSATPSVSNAKRNIQRKADELLRLIETQYDDS
jgi:hypothetical protein